MGLKMMRLKTLRSKVSRALLMGRWRLQSEKCGAFRSPANTESGSVILMVALTTTITLGIVIAGLVIGRLSFNRRELQNAADALALAGAFNLQQNGLPFQASTPLPYLPDNTRLPGAPFFTVIHRPTENRAIVQVDINGIFDSEQTWFQRTFNVQVRSFAQVNEMVFGESWPALTIVIDASESMQLPILASNGQSAFQVLRNVVLAYASNTLPVRNGVVVFNNNVVSQAPPPVGKNNNLSAISTALNSASPQGRTNAFAALQRGRQQLQNLPGGRNMIFISDGEPTVGGPCAVNEPCHFTVANQEASRVRNDAQAAIFSVEIRRTNFTTQAEQLLTGIAGLPNTAGGDSSMSYLVQGALGIVQFITGLTRSICAFGPLSPGPGAPPDTLRPRSTNGNLSGPPRRVFAFIREPTGTEWSIPIVTNRDTIPSTQQGFEYFTDASGAYVILSLGTCNHLGENPDRRLVVRWDDAQLVGL